MKNPTTPRLRRTRLLLLSVLMLVSCNAYSAIVRIKPEVDVSVQIDYGAAKGWTTMKKFEATKYSKTDLPSLSSDSGDRYIYYKIGSSIYRTQKSYSSPEVVTIGKDGKTYTVQTLSEWNLGKTAADKNLPGIKITDKQFNEQRKLSSQALKDYKTKTEKDIANIKIIGTDKEKPKTKDPIAKLNDMLRLQIAMINDAKTKTGATKEELDFETKIQKALEDQIKKLEDEIKKVAKDKEDYINSAKKSISDIEKIGKSPEIKDITTLQSEITKLQKRLEGQTAMIKKAVPSTAAYKLEYEKLVEKALENKIKELKEMLAKKKKQGETVDKGKDQFNQTQKEEALFSSLDERDIWRNFKDSFYKLENSGYKKSIYEIFKIENNAQESDIPKAYKKAMFLYHPDKAAENNLTNEQATIFTVYINEIKSVLTNKNLRNFYDKNYLPKYQK